MLDVIRGHQIWQRWPTKEFIAAALCVVGMGIGGYGVALRAGPGSSSARADEPVPGTYCQNQGASYKCTPVPIGCSGNCSAISGARVCDDSHQVQGCQSAWFSSCSSAPDYQCEMEATYTGNCAGGTCQLGAPFVQLCPGGDQLAQCQ